MRNSIKVWVYGFFMCGGVLVLSIICLILFGGNTLVITHWFEVEDINLWETAYIYSERTALLSLPWTVIQEINYISGNVYTVVFRKERELLAEKGHREIRREVWYVHTERWEYELVLSIRYDFLWFELRKTLRAEYLVR